MTEKDGSHADVMSLVAPKVATRFGRGRTPLLEAHRAGLVGLPDAVLRALTALGHVEVARRGLHAADPGAARAAYNAKVLAAVRDGADLSAADEVETVERHARLHNIQLVALDQAQQQLGNELEVALADGDSLVAGYVRPALTKLYGEARALLAEHGPRMAGAAEGVLGEPARVTKAWSRFGEAAGQAATLRHVHGGLTLATCGHDQRGDFLVTRDDPRDERLWGASFVRRGQLTEFPWPTDTRGHLGWLLGSGVKVWVPTGVERDERWGQVFGETQTLAMPGGGTRQVLATATAGLAVDA